MRRRLRCSGLLFHLFCHASESLLNREFHITEYAIVRCEKNSLFINDRNPKTKLCGFRQAYFRKRQRSEASDKCTARLADCRILTSKSFREQRSYLQIAELHTRPVGASTKSTSAVCILMRVEMRIRNTAAQRIALRLAEPTIKQPVIMKRNLPSNACLSVSSTTQYKNSVHSIEPVTNGTRSFCSTRIKKPSKCPGGGSARLIRNLCDFSAHVMWDYYRRP